MKKWIAPILASFAITLAHAAPDADEFNDVELYNSSACRQALVSKCWKSQADSMAKLKDRATDKQRENLLIAYWMMAKEAEFVGDLQDAKSIYDTVLDLAGGVKDKDAAPAQMRAIVLCDTAELALRMHDYASSLKQIDELISYNPNLADGPIGNSISLFRAAALIGLGRKTEADKVLTALLQHLDYGGISPWEGLPLGPQPVSPYNVARRVAAYYVREHRYTDALALLKELEEKRQKTLAEAPARPEPGGYWAEHVKLEDFMDDEADVYIAQGKDSEAEKLLQVSLALRKNAPATKQERYVLEKLATLEQRMGKTAESANLSQRAAALVIKTDLAWTDPLDDILGLPNPTHLAD